MKLWISSHLTGIYVCSQCGHKLFNAKSKYAHHTPWPAFKETLLTDSVAKRPETEPQESSSATALKVKGGWGVKGEARGEGWRVRPWVRGEGRGHGWGVKGEAMGEGWYGCTPYISHVQQICAAVNFFFPIYSRMGFLSRVYSFTQVQNPCFQL